ncbi:alpha-(1,3)-fucosyltransferase 10 isoform X1 [Monomorium pharaonis]|uniref:alpha-(1,3)-fucosyltransferase 10 isoform X1 n=1 Tax=Monomorium pharaonis TaxID=307658 RepID=UPI00174754BA|nr:alpha-(1,3)-fucosyltransferase 10 isoform X1 [Monomorium pharaonis]
MPRRMCVMFAIVLSLFIIFQLRLLCNYKRLFFLGDENIPVILWWTPFGNNNRIKTCGNVKCYFSHNRTFESSINLKSILFYGSDLRIHDLPSWRSGAISWGLLHEESPRNNPILVHEEALNLFNYSSTFSRFSNVPLTLLDLSGLEELIAESYYVPTKEKSMLMHVENLAPVLYIQSDCDTVSDRDRYILELIKHIRIDSYGACLNNAKLNDKLRNNYLDILNDHEFLSFVARYKFTIAFENAICDDYITEKLWRPLIVGSVPIYYGSPSFKDWLPNNKSAISISDFDGPIQLANFLHNLLKNDSAYEEYLSHKLSERKSRITNNKLLHALERRGTETPNKFGNYMEEFECFVCERIQKNNQELEEISIVTKRQYNCSLPRDPITRKINNRNWWMQQWNIEKCGAKLLIHYVTNNISININHFDEQKMNMYDNNEC